MFQHHPDGYIIINGEQFPLAFFRQVEPAYSLPDGFAGRTYIPNEAHQIFNSQSSEPQPLEWADGDRYISKLPVYRALYAQTQKPKVRIIDRKVRPLW